MSRGARRISVVATAFVAALAAVLVQLFVVMVEQHEDWLLRSYQNRWTFRDVPARRGPIVDRHGHRLAWDEPSFALHGYYRDFRRRHAVGVAVHGASLWVRSHRAPAPARFSYLPADPSAGPRQACRVLLSVPLSLLREEGGLPEQVRVDLRFYATSLLAALADLPYRRVSGLLAEALADRRAGAVAGVLPRGNRAGLLVAFEERWSELEALDQALRELDGRGLLERLETWRRRWEEDERAGRPDFERQERWVLRLVDGVPFGLAAALRLSDRRHPGLILRPSVRRQRAPELEAGHSLASLIGNVWSLDRLERQPLDLTMERRRQLFESRAARDALVPEDLPLEDLRYYLERRAENVFDAVLRNRGRVGTSGMEKANDSVLAGLPGLRLVARDKRAREHAQFRNLDVAPGQPVVATLDLELQAHLEAATDAFYQRLRGDALARWQEQGRDPARIDGLLARLEVALAVLDARTGDLLALGGRPLRIPGPDGEPLPRGLPPGLAWRSTGALGSTVKPFVLLEQLDALAKGRPARDPHGFADCTGRYRAGSRRLTCMHAHGHGGTDPIAALAESCNSFFYQAAEGLGQAGLQRALARVGLCDAAGTVPAWQPHLFGVPPEISPRPRWEGSLLVQERAIGYGISASAVHVARAYAALATGRLPFVSVVREDGRRPPLPLRVEPGALTTVREGLRRCVDSGSASRVAGLREFRVYGKTGTAEVHARAGDNNAWFAGYLPPAGGEDAQLAFCAVAYGVPGGFYGGAVAGELVADFLQRVADDPATRARYLSGN